MILPEKPDYTFAQLKTKNIDGRRHYVTTEGDSFISITTLLGHFSKKGIAAWRKKVGEEEANRITAESSSNGTAMPTLLRYTSKGVITKKQSNLKTSKINLIV